MTDQRDSNGRIGRTSAFEQHAQTIVQFVVAGLIGWLATTGQATAVKVAELTVEVRNFIQSGRDHSTRVDVALAQLVDTVAEHERRLAVIEAEARIHDRAVPGSQPNRTAQREPPP